MLQKKNAHKVEKNFLELIEYEKKYLYTNGLYNFEKKVIDSKIKIYKLLEEIGAYGKKIYGISAPSRATTLCNYLGFNRQIIECILEIDGSKKIDHFLPGTDIPILNEKKLYLDQPSYAFIFSWHIKDEIIINLRKKGYRGKFIVPLPKPTIID